MNAVSAAYKHDARWGVGVGGEQGTPRLASSSLPRTGTRRVVVALLLHTSPKPRINPLVALLPDNRYAPYLPVPPRTSAERHVRRLRPAWRCAAHARRSTAWAGKSLRGRRWASVLVGLRTPAQNETSLANGGGPLPWGRRRAQCQSDTGEVPKQTRGQRPGWRGLAWRGHGRVSVASDPTRGHSPIASAHTEHTFMMSGGSSLGKGH